MITDPSIAYMLMLIGIYGLFFEFSNPGFVLPGVVGGICLLLALYALQMLPVNYAGLALILLGIAFMVAEAFVPSFGALGIGGIIAFVIGSVMLIDTRCAGFGIPWPLIGAWRSPRRLVHSSSAAWRLKARRRPVVSGSEELIGASARSSKIRRRRRLGAGATASSGRCAAAQPLRRGQRVRVTRVDGLMLEVAADGPNRTRHEGAST